jgi:hypothetical protein
VRIRKAEPGETGTVAPDGPAMRPYPGMTEAPVDLAYRATGKGR